MPESNAWLLTFNNKDSVAIGEKELLHIITEPELHYVPKAKKYCQNIISWQDQILPVTNINGYVNNSEAKLSNIIGIVAYRPTDTDEIKYSAIDLTGIPKKITVNDEQACQITDEIKQWKPYSVACFNYNDKATPIINLSAFF